MPAVLTRRVSSALFPTPSLPRMESAEDDIDSLLAEIEGTLGGAGLGPAVPAGKPAAATVVRTPSAEPPDEIDSLLEELGGGPAHGVHEPGGTSAGLRAAAAQPQPQPAAFTALPAVPGLRYGRTALRCTRCDFRVLRFRGRRWAPAVDYMFLRNYMPEAHKLQEMLARADGARAAAGRTPAARPPRRAADPGPRARPLDVPPVRAGLDAYGCQCMWESVERSGSTSIPHWRRSASLQADPSDDD